MKVLVHCAFVVDVLAISKSIATTRLEQRRKKRLERKHLVPSKILVKRRKKLRRSMVHGCWSRGGKTWFEMDEDVALTNSFKMGTG